MSDPAATRECAAPALTDAELGEMEAKAAKATPGPWKWLKHTLREGWYRFNLQSQTAVIERPDSIFRACPKSALMFESQWGGSQDDFDFIENAREDVPRLISEVRRLRSEVAAAEVRGAERMREQAAERAFKVIEAIDGQPSYSTLQKAAAVAASIRQLQTADSLPPPAEGAGEKDVTHA